MEYIKYNSLGQWELLEKSFAKPPFNPQAEWKTPGSKARMDWASDIEDPEGQRAAKAAIPRMEGPARQRALSKLTAATSFRRNPVNNKLEFLLHRGMSQGEKNTHTKDNQVAHPPGTITSWTPNMKVADRQGYYEEPKGVVVSSWIPEDRLHSSLRQYSGPTKRNKDITRQEDEWIVHHDDPMDVHSVKVAERPKKSIK